MKESEFAAGQGGHINQVSREGPASAAPDLPEPRVFFADDYWTEMPDRVVAKSDYDALRAAYERVLTQRDEENVRAIRAEKGWDETINRAEAAEAALAQANAALDLALERLDSVRFMWNGPIHEAAEALRRARGAK